MKMIEIAKRMTIGIPVHVTGASLKEYFRSKCGDSGCPDFPYETLTDEKMYQADVTSVGADFVNLNFYDEVSGLDSRIEMLGIEHVVLCSSSPFGIVDLGKFYEIEKSN